MPTLQIYDVLDGVPYRDHGGFGLAVSSGLDGSSADQGIAAMCDTIRDWGAAAVLSISDPRGGLHNRRLASFARSVRERHMSWYHLELAAGELPSAETDQAWLEIGPALHGLVRNGFRVLVHSEVNPEPAAMMIVRALQEIGGCDFHDLLYRVRRAGPTLLASPALEAAVRSSKLIRAAAPETTPAAIRDRAVGALVGLAVGDALGTTLEFKARDRYPLLTDIIGGGPFGLQPGEWTDDTAMSLALADTLREMDVLDDWPKKLRLIEQAKRDHPKVLGYYNQALDDAVAKIERGDYPNSRRRFERALLERFVAWQERGDYSCNGRCFDIGATVSAALANWKHRRDPLAGSTAPTSAGNGSLMRLAPVAIRYFDDRTRLRDYAARQSRTTHGAAEAVDACVAYAELLADAISGKPAKEVLKPHRVALPGVRRDTDPVPRKPIYAEAIERILMGSWRGKDRADIRATGYVVHSFEAALWSVGRTGNFADAVLTSANLGEDADTTAAITGQLAGALYGANAIPSEWRAKLAWHDRIVSAAEALLPKDIAHAG